MRNRLVVAICLGICAFSGSNMFAQERVTDGKPTVVSSVSKAPFGQWGTQNLICYVVPAFGMQSIDGSIQTWAGGGSYNRYSPSGAEVEAPLQLPTGALVTTVEIQACDTSATDEVLYGMFKVDASGTPTVLSPIASTGIAATPGCGYFSVGLTSPETINNYLSAYYIVVHGGTTNATNYGAGRVYYRLQISPAPSTPSFVDVPNDGSIFYQSVEALKASGITLGCDATHFCPSAPVTRLQMAVFLARALGLHWNY